MIADSRPRRIARAVLALAYLIAGVAHLRSPGGFIAITPDWVPYPATVIWLTGIAEIAGSIGLMLPPFRHAAASDWRSMPCVYGRPISIMRSATFR